MCQIEAIIRRATDRITAFSLATTHDKSNPIMSAIVAILNKNHRRFLKAKPLIMMDYLGILQKKQDDYG
ncbi:hypothetical protein GCM10009129_22040 [Psychrobacter aestuarii]|uniref:Transposase n=1 Tax=Psychrobacter aestuarii TaxID=556327 RepID=A0ABN0W375_9GAMM